MFKRILIANRGEIACRIIKTARKMGISTVAVYSDADRDALHVEMADEAVHIGPPAAAESYLQIEKIIAACKQTRAEAVHPGYGFLSEREAFPRALAKAGIVFIGPNPDAIAAMGDKIESKKAAAKAKVPTVPGHLGGIEDEKHAVKIADQIGYPVMIKASAGGGGKGMRIAHSKGEVAEGFARARADALAKAVGYDSAGTVEFVAGQDSSFFFLEMNTRLQVEHPVPELVTGIDLVEQMIRVAAGEKLKLKQSDVKLSGWAVESRVYAEDPTRNFLPSTGRLTTYRPPAEKQVDGITVRNDTGVYEGGEISIWYDPMIAKLVTHAKTRDAAIEAQADALDAFAIDGIRHNIPFLTALMAHPRWRAGKLSTGFIAEEYPDGFHNPAPGEETARVLACVAVAIDHKLGARKRQISGQLTGRVVTRATSRRVWLNASEYVVEIADESSAQLRFGDGATGIVPQASDSLCVRYRGGA